jgi:hypothetical protein
MLTRRKLAEVFDVNILDENFIDSINVFFFCLQQRKGRRVTIDASSEVDILAK